MKKIICPIIIIIILCLFVGYENTSAAAKTDINIDINIKPSFIHGDSILFDYTIVSSETQKISYTPRVACPNGPTELFAVQEIDLLRNSPFIGNHKYIVIDDSIEPQTCTAYIQILNPTQKTVEKKFEIRTNPSFKFNLFTCKDQQCQNKSKTFIKNDNIYVAYESEVKDPEISAKLVFPNKKEQDITLPYSFVANQIGTYNLEATYSKEGYKTKTLNYQFAIIEKEPEIAFVGICNANGICDEKEDSQNCPQDCFAKEKKEIGFFQRSKIGLFILAGLALLGIIALIRRIQRVRGTF